MLNTIDFFFVIAESVVCWIELMKTFIIHFNGYFFFSSTVNGCGRLMSEIIFFLFSFNRLKFVNAFGYENFISTENCFFILKSETETVNSIIFINTLKDLVFFSFLFFLLFRSILINNLFYIVCNKAQIF